MNERDIFIAAIEITDSALRAAYVAQACGDNGELRMEVEELLQAHAQSSQFLEQPASANDSSNAQTIVTTPLDSDDDPGADRASGEAEFCKFLLPATRPGWLGRLAHYEIEAILGRGAFGIVAKAFDEKLHRVVAIKLMNPELASTSPPRKRFLREARTAAAVTHENIVAIYAVEEEPIPYLVMEYIPGQTLQQRMNATGPLEAPAILRIGQQLAAGLAAAHAAKLIHRDIKPANILLADGPTVRAKISDFGLARAVDDATMTSSGVIAGTPLYMAPEQARGETLDHRADLFSLGSVLYQMASGRPPFRAANTVAVLKRVCEDAPRPLDDVIPGIPGWLQTIVFRLLEKKREDRYQTAQEVTDLLVRCQSELQHQGHVTCVPERPSAAAETMVFPAPSSDRSVSRPWHIGWLAGGMLIVATLIGLLLLNVARKNPDVTAVKHPDETTTTATVQNPAESPTLAGWRGWPADAPKPAIAPFDAAQAKKHQDEWAAYLKVPVEYTNSIGMKFRLIPPGEFTMGSKPSEIERALLQVEDKLWRRTILSEGPQHKVILTQPMYVGVNEVTQANYETVMKTTPSNFAATGAGKEAVVNIDTTQHPVEMVSWNAAAEFCVKLSQQERLESTYLPDEGIGNRLNGSGYRLPTEAEWEFACRAGTTTKYWIGDSSENLATASWFSLNSEWRTHPVGELRANPWGFCDILGNVSEWVNDAWDSAYYSEFMEQPAVNPNRLAAPGSLRVIRSGDIFSEVPRSLSSSRTAGTPDYSQPFIGFRVALPVSAVRQMLTEKSMALGKSDSSWHGWTADAPKPAISPFDADQAKLHQNEWATYLEVPVEYENSIGMKFVLIPPGEFTMGSTAEEIGAVLKDVSPDNKSWRERIKSEAPQHKVILTQPIYLGVNEVTQAEYEKVMGSNPSHFAPRGMGKEAVAGLETADHPVEMVSWNDAAEFCAKLSKQENLKPFYFRAGETITPLDGTGYRLPSEADWEFACRAGTATKYWIGEKDEDLVRAGWFRGNSGGRTHAAGELKSNPFGLNDIHGNVWEWMQDGWDPTFYGQFQEKPAINPNSLLPADSQHVARGGNWRDPASNCRSSYRDARDPPLRDNYLGLRVSLAVDAVKAAVAPKVASLAELKPGWHGWPADAPKPAIAPFDAAQAKQHQEEWAAYLKVPVEYTNSIGMRFRLIPPGEFLMGSPVERIAEDLGRAAQITPNKFWQECIVSTGPQHRVILTQPIYIGTHEVTQTQFSQILKRNPSRYATTGTDPAFRSRVEGVDTSAHPVESITWNDTIDFCSKLSEAESWKPFYSREGETVTELAGTGYRLPTEAEWEFACSAGTTTRYWNGDDEESAHSVGWFQETAHNQTHPVGRLPANPLGLFDVHGNVWEWCEDAWDANFHKRNAAETLINPKTPFLAGPDRVAKGGDLKNATICAESAYRHRGYAKKMENSLLFGFRIVLTVEAVKQAVNRKPARDTTTYRSWPADAPKPAIAPFDVAQAKQHQEEWAAYLQVPVKRKIELPGNTKLTLVLVPPGQFRMGSGDAEQARFEERARVVKDQFAINLIATEGPQHLVNLTQPFYLGECEMTQAQWQAVMGENPAEFQEEASCPVERVSWDEVQAALERLNERHAPPGMTFVLPTESQWEYACRAGTSSYWHCGDKEVALDDYGWTFPNAGLKTHPVARLTPNAWGLHDMHGNVWEWCSDWHTASYYQKSPPEDPPGPPDGLGPVLRGGSWKSLPIFGRSAYRYFHQPSESRSWIGFRLAARMTSLPTTNAGSEPPP